MIKNELKRKPKPLLKKLLLVFLMIARKISIKINQILHLFSICLLLILMRVWYLSVIQYQKHYELSKAPQRRTIIDRVERATIRDRFNLPLAINKLQYNATICYADIRQIPNASWEKNEKGKLYKALTRKNYIEKLAHFLSVQLEMDPLEIEDIIYGKASLFPHTPFVLKADISEKLYFFLKIREKDWVGLHMQKAAKRIYPQGKVACDVLGYMGAISQKEYQGIAQELHQLRSYLEEREAGFPIFLPKGYKNPQEVRDRLHELEQRAYTINDQVGKSGVEAAFDEILRGESGKKTFEIDIKGNYRHLLPGSKPALSGERLILSISAELQKEAESLLAEYELLQEAKDQLKSKHRRHPWIRGGAIVVMQPKTGEILSLTSSPRFDPNDFITSLHPEKQKAKRSAIFQWLESESHIGEIWDGKVPLQKEVYSSKKKQFYLEEVYLTWNDFLDKILSQASPLRKSMYSLDTVKKAYLIQNHIEQLLQLSLQTNIPLLIQALYPEAEPLRCGFEKKEIASIKKNLAQDIEKMLFFKEEIDPYLASIPHNDDKILLIDLLRLIVPKEHFTHSLVDTAQYQSLFSLHQYTQTLCYYREKIQEIVYRLFCDLDFLTWRKVHFDEFLRKKRRGEKQQKTWARPYVEYLAKEKMQQFASFWKKYSEDFLAIFVRNSFSGKNERSLFPYFKAIIEFRQTCQDEKLEELKDFLLSLHQHDQMSYLKALRPFSSLTRPLIGHYPSLRNTTGQQLEKDLASAFYPIGGFGYGRSHAFRQSSPMGSIFKIIPAYTALKQCYESGAQHLSPLKIIDQLQWTAHPGSNHQVMGYLENGEQIKRFYHGGRLPRGYKNVGEIDIIGALERSSNIYFSILMGDFLKSPKQLLDAASNFGIGKSTNIDLPGEYKGCLPQDIIHDKTSLYALAIGQHSLIATPLQAAKVMTCFANRGEMVKPQIVKLSAGKKPNKEKQSFFLLKEYPYKKELSLLGIHFPFFTQNFYAEENGFISFRQKEIEYIVDFPKPIHSILMEGMYHVTNGFRGTARPSAVSGPYHTQETLQTYRQIHTQMIGKTGTAEILYKQTVDAATPADLEKHVWFGGISYADSQRSDPELVVIVYLRFGEAGKYGAPMAARLVKKWQELNH